MTENHENFSGLLEFEDDDDRATSLRAKQSSADALLLLFERADVLPAPSSAPRAEPLAPIVAPASIPSDPNVGSQWHLLNTGQFGGTPGIDINVTRAWDDYSGQGVRVGVVDDGVEYTHEDLLGTYDTTTDWDPASNDSNAFPGSSDRHGTAVAGLIGADNDNGLGGVGVAYDSTLTGYRIFGGSVTFSEFKAIFDRHVSDNLDLSNNSWTFTGQFADNFLVSGFSSIGAGIDNAVTNGRGGLGSVILFAAGNGRLDGDSSDYHNMQNSRETISVAAVDNTGNVSWYSNPGASLLVATPSNGGTAGIYTTDRTGSLGYSSGEYTGVFGGTSAATPITAGVVALMLEANPNLGYRDVQEILAYSARLVDAGDPGWAWNGADNWNGGGLHSSHDYGFGLTDATAAVRLAETWSLQSTRANEVTVGGTSAPAVAIPDGGSVSDTITLASGLEIDHVEVFLNISHNNIGDLVVKLQSPDGTESVIVNRPGKDPGSSSDPGSTANNIGFIFDSTNHWGETGVGTWTLIVEDHRAGTAGTLVNWNLDLYGDVASDDDLYVYTDEYGSFSGPGDASRRLLEDGGGTDRLNAAAVTSDITLDLTPGAGGTLAGNSLTIGATTVIEEVVLGDGDDSLTGNDADNLLWGGRGDDDLDGGAGNDLALYSHAIADYSITYVDAVSVTIDYIGAGSLDEGLDSVTNVESFSFDGALYAFAELVAGDPPPPPTTGFAIGATDAVKAEGDSGTTQFTFTVTRSGDLSGADSVDWAVTGSGSDPADAADFGGNLPSGTLAFAAGETSQDVTIDVTGDSDVEVDEGFTVTLSNPSADTSITTASAVGTIQNDDVLPPGSSVTLIDTSFDGGDLGGFVYSDGVFGGSTSQAYATGQWDTGALSIELGGQDNVDILDMSGAWQFAFTLDEEMSLEISFLHELIQTPFYESDEFGQIFYSLSGSAPVLLGQLTGDGNSGPTQTTGVQAYATDLGVLAAGSYTLSLGGYSNKKTFNNETTEVRFDEVQLIATPAAAPPPSPDSFFEIASTDAVKAEGDAGSSQFTFTVTRSGDLTGADQVDFAVTGGAADAADFGGALPSGTVSFAAGEASKVVTLDVSGDTDFEADEGFTVTLSNASAGSEITKASADGTIQNDDPHASFAIAATDAVKAEGDAGTTSYSFTVTRSGVLSGADQVDFAVTGGGADAADFGGALPSGTVSFAAGETTQVVTIDVTGDTDFEADEAFTVTLSNASAGTEITTASADGTIQNDDPHASFAIAATDAVKAEGDAGTTNYTFTVTRSGVLSGADQVDFAVTGGAADAADFGGALPSGTVSFAAGETSKVVMIDVSGDTDFEADENFTVALSNASAGTEITTASADGAIQNDDPHASFAVAATDATKAEGDAGTTSYSFTVTRSGVLSGADQVDFTVTGGAADAADFGGSLPSGTIAFAAGEASKVVTIDVAGDTDFEADEDFTVTLSNASAGTEIATASADGTIQNDDPHASFAIAATDAVKAEGDAGTTNYSFTVTRTGVLSNADSVDWAVAGSGGDPADTADFGGALPNGRLDFAAGEASKTITVSVSGDANFEADEGFTVTLSNASAGTEITAASADGTIQNDDLAPPATFFEIAATDADKSEGDAGTTQYSFTVTRSGDLSGADQVDFGVTGAGADAADFGGALPSGTVAFAAGETSKLVTIDVSGDTDFEADEDFTVTLSNASAGTQITTVSANGTIQNDDPHASFAIAATDAVKAEGDAGTTHYTFTVTRSGVLSGADQVDFAVTGGGVDAADFGGSLPGGTVAFAAGETSKVVTIDVSGDTDFEADEDFTVTLSNASAGTQITTASDSGTIQNDDPHASFAIAATDAVKAEGDAGTTSYSFTVTRSGVLSGADQVDFAVTAGGADAADFGGALPSGTVAFAAGETTQVVTIDVSGDTDFEADEDFTITLSNPTAGTEITTPSATGTIQNDDPAPPATFFAIAATDAVKAEGDAGTTQFTFTVTRSGVLSGADQVDFAVTGAGADAADFGGSLPSGTVSFAAGETTQVVTIDVSGDTEFEADEDFTVTLSNASAGTEISTPSAVGTIQNDDPAPPATFFGIAATDAVKAEGDVGTTQYSFTVTRTGVLSSADSVDWAVLGSGGNPADASDFAGALPSGTLEFAAGEASKLVTLAVSGDADIEADEGFTVTLSNASAGTEITTASADGTISNDDNPPPVGPTTLVEESFDSSGDLGDFVYSDGVFGGSTAQAYASGQWEAGALGIDLGGIDNVTALDMSGAWQVSFTLDSAAAVSLSFVYELTQSAEYEFDEFSRALYSITGGPEVILAEITGDGAGGGAQTTGPQLHEAELGILAAGDYTLSIGGYSNKKTFNNELTELSFDDVLITSTPPPPVTTFFEIASLDAVKAEGNAGTSDFSFTISRSGDLSASDSVDFSVAGGGADPADGSDFEDDLLPSGSVAFAPGETSKTVTLSVAGDIFPEADEGFTVTLSNPSLGSEITTATANGTILDDEAAPGQSVLVQADFDAQGDVADFAYDDGVFGGSTSQPYADGQWSDGALEILLGGQDNADILDMSGAWQVSFSLDEEMSVVLAFDYLLSTTPHYESNEFTQVLYSLSGSAAVVVDELVGDGNSGPTPSTGLVSHVADLGVLAAGDYSLAIGAYNNLKTFNNEASTLLIDDVLIVGSATSPASAGASLEAVDAGAAALADAGTSPLEDAAATALTVTA